MGLVNNITKVISENMNINMKRLNFESDSGIFKGNIILSVKSNKEANKLIQKLKILNGIDIKMGCLESPINTPVICSQKIHESDPCIQNNTYFLEN